MPVDRNADRRPSSGSTARPSGDDKKAQADSTRFLSPLGRMAFQHLLEPDTKDNGDKKYEVTLLFPPDADLSDIKAKLYRAGDDFFKKKEWPRGARTPQDVIGDCEDKDYTGYKPGWHYIKFSSKDMPGIVDARKQEVLDPREVYNGRWARVSGSCYAYDNKSKGVACALNNVQLLQNDDTFSGRPRAEDEFDDKYADAADEGRNDRGGRDRDSDDDRGRGWGRGGDRDRDDRSDDRGSDRGRDSRGGRDADAGDDDRGRGRGRGRDDDAGGRGASRGRSEDDRGSARSGPNNDEGYEGRSKGHADDRSSNRRGNDDSRDSSRDSRQGRDRNGEADNRGERGDDNRSASRGRGVDRDDREADRGRGRGDNRDQSRHGSHDDDRNDDRRGSDESKRSTRDNRDDDDRWD